MRRWFGLAVVALLVAGGFVALVRSGRDGASGRKDGGAQTAETGAATDSVAGAKAGAPVANATGGGVNDTGAVPRADAKVVKRATIELRVPGRTLERRFASVSGLADLLGGYVASTDRSGAVATVSLRVPAAQFGTAMTRLAALGKVTARSERGDDVTAQFVDLDARIRNLAAQEAVLQDLMNRASSVPDTIAVQQQLSEVRGQIEQLTGQRNLLDDQASFATIAVTLHGAGVAAAPASDRGSLAQAWHDAVGVSVAILAGSIVVLGAVVPIGALVAIGLLIWTVVRRRRGPALHPAG